MPPPNKKPLPESSRAEISELKAGVVSLAGRVTQLADALKTVNDIQERVTRSEHDMKRAEKIASAAQERTDELENVMVPREEHEKVWKQEQQNLIKTRLSIRRQTYVLFFVSMAVLAVVAALVFNDLHVQAKQRHDQAVARCEQGNTFREGDLALWNKVLALSSHNPTTEQEATTQEFKQFLAEHDKLIDCSKV